MSFSSAPRDVPARRRHCIPPLRPCVLPPLLRVLTPPFVMSFVIIRDSPPPVSRVLSSDERRDILALEHFLHRSLDVRPRSRSLPRAQRDSSRSDRIAPSSSSCMVCAYLKKYGSASAPPGHEHGHENFVEQLSRVGRIAQTSRRRRLTADATLVRAAFGARDQPSPPEPPRTATPR